MKLAIVGTGVSGLVCAHLLQRDFDLTLFEADPRIGGHVNTVPVEVAGRLYPVDTGFIVFNRRTYPNFQRLLDRLGVATQKSDMSFALSCERTGLEYEGSLRGLVARPANLLRPGFYGMLRDLVRFQRDARELVASPDEKVALGDWLAGRGYGEDFVLRHLLPMGAAIWSAEPRRMREFPAATFARFFENHGLLSLHDRPSWRVVCGGSHTYVRRLVEPLRGRIRLSTPVQHVRRLPDAVEITPRGGSPERFDQVILALHSDQALAVLADPTPAERRVLGAIRYQENEAVLHTDARLLPRRRRAWASWNYLVPRDGDGRAVVTYHMNRLQKLDAPVELCVTLNAGERIDPRRVIETFSYHHPIFDAAAIEAQKHRDAVSGVNRTHYCGAWWRYGFHEDGVDSALAVARHFGRSL